jgi:hypothetical protein
VRSDRVIAVLPLLAIFSIRLFRFPNVSSIAGTSHHGVFPAAMTIVTRGEGLL